MVKKITTSVSDENYAFMKENNISPADVLSNHLTTLRANSGELRKIIDNLHKIIRNYETVIAKIPLDVYKQINQEINQGI